MKSMDMKKYFFLVLFVLISVIVHAQNLKVQGVVLSATDNFPVIGATVIETGNATNGVITDMDGKFELSVKQGSNLTISYVGFKSQTLKAESVMNILLHEDTEVLDEVVGCNWLFNPKKGRLDRICCRGFNRCIKNSFRSGSDACSAR